MSYDNQRLLGMLILLCLGVWALYGLAGRNVAKHVARFTSLLRSTRDCLDDAWDDVERLETHR